MKFIYLPESTEQALTSTLPEMVDNVDGLLIIPKLQDQNFENLQNKPNFWSIKILVLM